MKHESRRGFLKTSAAACLSLAIPSRIASAAVSAELSTQSAQTAAAHRLIERVLPAHAAQIHLQLLPAASAESFRISGTRGRIHVEGTSASSLLMGVHWYLKYVAGVSASWNGDCLDRLPALLPAPASPIAQQANVRHRFALNDTNDGYTGPYWTWERWERLIDMLALQGINEVLVYTGAEAVYQQTFRQFGYSGEELRQWFPTPAHQPWWLLQNMSGWVGPSISQQLIDMRLALAAKITQRLRELGMVPVLPGYYGMVPDAFAEKNPGARIVPQGAWLGMKRPDWLDPVGAQFSRVAAAYYRAQEELLGPSTIFKMDPLHEGGRADGVDIPGAARCIDEQLQKAHPGAIWAILGWQENPKREVLSGVKDKSRMLILDGVSDRFDYRDREQQWDDTPYAFGTIWNYGGHTTIGANLGVWNERYYKQLEKAGSKLQGIAMMPEASCNNLAAFAFFTELAWRPQRIDMARWFSDWSSYRYGGKSEHAARAWEILRTTAYDGKAGNWGEAHDNLFSAQPKLAAHSACSWAPQEPRYDLGAFAQAVNELLNVESSLRSSAAYRYDLVDVARQTIANSSRLLLPRIQAAYAKADLELFRQLSRQWLDRISLLERVVATEPSFLLGPWLAGARSAAKNESERAQYEFDARSLLLEWGSETSRGSGVADYANREWQGLLGFYRERWAAFFAMVEDALEKKTPLKEIDWFAFDQSWARKTDDYPLLPQGDVYRTVREAIAQIQE